MQVYDNITMGRFAVSRVIDAPRSETFALIANGENAPKWHPSVIVARIVGDTALGKGHRVHYVTQVGGLTYEFVTEAVEFEPERGFTDILYERVRGAIAKYRLSGHFESVGESTRVVLEFDYSLDFPFSLLDGLLQRQVRRQFEKGLEKAAHLLERTAC